MPSWHSSFLGCHLGNGIDWLTFSPKSRIPASRLQLTWLPMRWLSWLADGHFPAVSSQSFFTSILGVGQTLLTRSQILLDQVTTLYDNFYKFIYLMGPISKCSHTVVSKNFSSRVVGNTNIKSTIITYLLIFIHLKE